MIKASFLLLLFVFAYSLLPAQQSKIDSLCLVIKSANDDSTKITALNDLGKVYMDKGRFHLTDSLCHLALAISAKTGYAKGSMIAYNLIGNICIYQSNYPGALTNYLKFLDIAKAIGHKMAIANGYGNIGIVYYYQGNYPQALDNQLKCMKMREEIGDKQGIGSVYINIGAIYQFENDLNNALQYYTKGLKAKQDIGDKHGMASAYGNIGAIDILQHHYGDALQNELQCLKIDQEIGNKTGLSTTYGNIGSVYDEEGDYANAIKNQQLSLDIAKEIGDGFGVALAYLNLGNISVKQKKYTDAKANLDNALPLVNKLGDKELSATSFRYFANYDSATGNYNKAFSDFKSYLVFRDSLNNEENAKKIVREQMNFDFEQKELTLKAEEDKQNALDAEKLKRQTLITWLAAGGGLFVIVILGLLFNRSRLKQKNKYQKSLNQKQKEQATAVMNTQEEERKRIAEDIHDSLGQLLSTTKISLQKLSEDKKVGVEDPMSLLNHAVREIRDISFNLMPKTLEEAGLVPALQELASRISNSGSVKIGLHIHDVENLKLDRQTQFTLYRIVQEAINNSLKYSGATEINVQLIGESNTLVMMIEDDGKGFDMNTVKTGRGLKNMKSRSEWLNGKLAIDSGLGGGTTISVEIPV